MKLTDAVVEAMIRDFYVDDKQEIEILEHLQFAPENMDLAKKAFRGRLAQKRFAHTHELRVLIGRASGIEMLQASTAKKFKEVPFFLFFSFTCLDSLFCRSAARILLVNAVAFSPGICGPRSLQFLSLELIGLQMLCLLIWSPSGK